MEKNYRAELTGLFGDPVDSNPTGPMEEAGYRALGLNYRYITMRVLPEDLPVAMQAVRALHMKGVNLTMPHKIRVLPYLDELSEAARIIGAVNTVVVREDGSLFGENTDGKGFVEALLREGKHVGGTSVTILGAGGAARAIAVECALAGAASVTVIGRTPEKARELAELIDEKTGAAGAALAWESRIAVPEGTDILINATPVGFAADAGSRPDIDYGSVMPGMTAADVVFDPVMTPFLEEAGRRGAETVSGLGMLACQGARNFTLWTGREAPLEVLQEALRKEFEEG
ncbi:MAG: shikimate dehydrogenase [Firmicutes bacterium]|nr:shikimate dehydrogenase [Bacillota bacterium]